ncbi:MAG TPA: hypothetical protein ENI56_01240 [Candidatus Kaiserbacteria bacterium]|nr:hypothetical protein [Candidatus Kaiserbacteria bacterium]
MPLVPKNTNGTDVPVPKIHDKKFVVRTYAMDVAAAQQKIPNSSEIGGIPTPPISAPAPASASTSTSAPTPVANVPVPPKPPTANEIAHPPVSPVPMPIPMPTNIATAKTTSQPMPSSPTVSAPSAPAPIATPDLVRSLATQIHDELNTPKPQARSGLSSIPPTPPSFPPASPAGQGKQTHSLISKLARRKEAPEIPINLMITHRNQTADHGSVLAKAWTWLTGKSGEATHDGMEIQENIVVPRGNNIGHTEQSFPAETDIGKLAQDTMRVFNQEQMPSAQIASPENAVMAPTPPRQPETPEPVRTQETKPTENISHVRMETPAPITNSVAPVIATSPVATPAQHSQQESVQQARAQLVQQAYQDLAKAQAMTQSEITPEPHVSEPPPTPLPASPAGVWAGAASTPVPQTSAQIIADHARKEPNHPTISPLHTYRMDVTDTIKETGASTTSILAQQQNTQAIIRASSTSSEKEKRTLLWFTIGGALLFILSIVGIGYAYQYHAKKVAPAHIALPVPSLVPTNTTEELSGTGIVLLGELSHVAKTPLQNGMIKTVYIATTTKERNGTIEKRPLPGGYLIAAMGLPMPAILMNNTAVDSTVGVVGADNQTYPFFILRVASYDSAFAGMLRWESSLASDMRTLYPTPVASVSATRTATTTATQTFLANTQTLPSSASFVDATIANHTVRVLQNSAGQSILLYGFANKHTLIIARNAAAFTVLLGKLSQQ